MRGPIVDAETRCVHYRAAKDIVAIKFRCCGEFYPCTHCHSEAAGHEAQRWSLDEASEPAILCGVCGTVMPIDRYMNYGECDGCGSGFNPRCMLHYSYYFKFDKEQL